MKRRARILKRKEEMQFGVKEICLVARGSNKYFNARLG
jgi:hypothetical protein